MGIKYKLRAATLLPVLLVSLLFAFFYNALFSQDISEHISRLGKAYIHQLLPAAQFAMLRNDDMILQGLINASMINPEIKALAFYNTQGQLIAYKGGKYSLKHPFKPPKYTGDYIETKQVNPNTLNFVAPIRLANFKLYANLKALKGVSVAPELAFQKQATPFTYDVKPTLVQTHDILGWLSIDVDTHPLLIKRYQMLVVSFFITLFALLLGLLLHHVLAKRIYFPIAQLKRSMRQILRNEFETEILVSSKGELGIIEKGCAHLQKKYLCTLQSMQQQIDTATEDLHKGLELLEEKNIELTMDKKRTEEHSRQKSEFIANMSHEIRTPMNGVIGFTEILLESKLDPLQLEYVKTIKSSAQDLLSIINDILDFSKINAGKLHLDTIPLDIRTCINEVLALAGPHAQKKNINLICITEVNVPKTVLGDPIRIRQIISNLITNAVKFTDHGHVLIRTKIEHESEKDYTLSLTISDTGIGISPEDQSKLFTAFNQADTSISRRYGGSGLGLVICKKLCEKMHGRISFNSTVHKGSTFSATIRIDKLLAYEVEKSQTHRYAHIKALCFDDNALYLESLSKSLEFLGIDCTTVASFHKIAKEIKRSKRYTVIFIAYNPGFEQQIAELIAKNNHLTFILVATSPLKDWTALRAFEGPHGIIYQPLCMQKLHNIIESVYDKLLAQGHAKALSTTEALNRSHVAEELQHFGYHELHQLRQQLQSMQLKLLVAEDNPVNKMLLDSLLGNLAQVVLVDDGEMAMAACTTGAFDIILLDLHMPKRNGLEAAAFIRTQAAFNQQTPIVLISASSADVDLLALKQSGIDFCMQKPIDEKTLITQLVRIASTNPQKAIDWQLCVERVGGDTTLAKEFLTQFIQELRINRAEFFLLLQQNNFQGLQDTAHKLKGACCFCGVPTLLKKVNAFEISMHNQSVTEALSHAFKELIQSIDAVLEEYLTYYGRSVKEQKCL